MINHFYCYCCCFCYFQVLFADDVDDVDDVDDDDDDDDGHHDDYDVVVCVLVVGVFVIEQIMTWPSRYSQAFVIP